MVGLVYWYEFRANNGEFKTLNWTESAFLYLGIGLIMMAFRDLAYMVRVRILTGRRLNWKQAFNVIMLWEFASAITPGVVGGSAAALFILEREKIPLGQSTALVIITLILDNLFYILFIPIVFFTVTSRALFPSDLEWLKENGLTVFWLAYSIIVVINTALILSVFISPRLITGVVNLIYKLPFLKNRRAKAIQFGKDIETASNTLKNQPLGYWLKLFLTTIWSWAARFLVLNFVLFAFIELQLIDHLMVLARQLMMWLTLLVTPTPGGSGMAEFAFSVLFADYINPVGFSAVGLALVWRTLSYYPYLLIGSILLPRWLKKTA